MDAFDLHEQFSINNTTTELSIREGEGGIPVIHLTNTHCAARISLQGAHLLSWIPNDEKDVIWVSQDAKFAQGKSVRGGVPICWPWFGPHATEANWPAHGFARTSQWNVVEIDVLEDGATRIYFTLNPTHAIKAMWPDGCTVDCIMTIGKRLSFELITHNEGDAPVTIGQAFHTYFNIGDIEKTVILGLDETDYLDKTEGFARKHQIGPVVINDEVDRIYLNTATDCIVEDRGNVREIIIEISFFFKCFANFMQQVMEGGKEQSELIQKAIDKDKLSKTFSRRLRRNTNDFYVTQTAEWAAVEIVSAKFVDNFIDGWSKLNKLSGTYLTGDELKDFLGAASKKIEEISFRRKQASSARLAELNRYRARIEAEA
ncbi:MAG: D-hexose-6-phosphate mutarotase [Gammaproteobacteria bacterium]